MEKTIAIQSLNNFGAAPALPYAYPPRTPGWFHQLVDCYSKVCLRIIEG